MKVTAIDLQGPSIVYELCDGALVLEVFKMPETGWGTSIRTKTSVSNDSSVEAAKKLGFLCHKASAEIAEAIEAGVGYFEKVSLVDMLESA